MKPKFYGAITILVLSVSLLFNAQVYAIENNSISQTIITQKPKQQENITQQFEDLKQEITSFNQELKKIANKEKNSNNFNSENVLSQLENLRKVVNSLPNDPQLSSVINNINTEITALEKIIKPLENGLNKDAVTQVQKDLGFFPRRNISPQNYGVFGKTTQEEIEKFTNNKIEQLEAKIKSLESLLTSNSISSPSNNAVNRVNNDRNDQIDANTVNRRLNTLTATVIILGFLLVGLVLFCIYRIITIVEQQRKLAGLVKTNQNFIDTENFQIQMNEIFKTLNNLNHRLQQLENNQINQPQNPPQIPPPSASYPSNTSNIRTNTNISQFPSNPQNPQPIVTNKPSTTSTNFSHLSNTNIQLVSTYNMNARSLSNQAITVSESEYTAEQRRLGRNIQPILQSDSRGNYWILTEGNTEYLVPKAKMKINEHNYLTISTFFNCSGYNPNTINNFTLIKPARVSSIGDKWELVEVGELEF